jgi:cytochrome b561
MHQLRSAYSFRSKIMHWLVAIIVLSLLVFGFNLSRMPKTMKFTAIMFHKSFGLTVLALMLFRIIFILRDGRPSLPSTTPCWEKLLARFVQYGLYALLILMPLSGWIMSVAAGYVPKYFGLVAIPFPGIEKNIQLANLMKASHKTLAWIIVAFVVLHLLGNIKHYFLDKDTVVQTMLFKGNNRMKIKG